MPGHKASKKFKKFFPISDYDITELSYSDDLQSPSGAIKKAQQSVAKIVGAANAFFLTDGSSSGVITLLYAAKKFGDKIIIFKNSHKSVYNACRILGLEPIILQGEEMDGMVFAPQVSAVERIFESQTGVAGVFATSPDYYGNVAPLKDYAEVCKKHGKLLLCDGAHGAHLVFGEDKILHCGNYCNAWVDGAHKSLPTLTQGALLCVNDGKILFDIEEGLNIFRTTSPSYPIMASIEFGYKYLSENYNKVANVKGEITGFKYRLSKFTIYPSTDWTKLVIDCKAMGISPDKTQKYLEKNGIFAEMNDGRFLVFYLSALTEKNQLIKLEKRLQKGYNKNKLKGDCYKLENIPKTQRQQSYLSAINEESEYVLLAKAEGRIAAENFGVSPPCVPIVAAGEKITAEVIAFMQKSKNTFGVYGGKIKVVKI